MDRKERFRRLRILLLAGLGTLAAAAAYSALARRGLGLPCLFRSFTGLLCPGCGNNGAALALLRLDILGTFAYNPMFLPEILYISWVLFHCCRSYLKGGRFNYKPPLPWLDIALLAALLLWWLLRNLI